MEWTRTTRWIAAALVLAVAGGAFAWWRNSLYYATVARVTPVDADEDAGQELVVFYDEPAPVSRTLDNWADIELVDQHVSQVVAYQIPSGAPIWTISVRDLQFAFPYDGIQHEQGPLVVSHPHPAPGLAAFEPETGRVLWRYRIDAAHREPTKPAYWAYRRGETVVASERTIGSGKCSTRSFDAETGEPGWRAEGAGFGYHGQFTDERLVAAASKCAPEGGTIVSIDRADGTVRHFQGEAEPIALDDRFYVVRDSEAGGPKRLEVVRDGEATASPVTVEGEPVTFRGRAIGIHDGRFLYLSDPLQRGYGGLSAVPLEADVEGFEHSFADGFAYYRMLRDMNVVAARFSPYRRIRGRVLPIPLRKSGGRGERQRLVLLEADTGRVHWRSDTFELPGDSDRWHQEPYSFGYADGDYVALFPKMWTDTGLGVLSIDAQTGRIRGAAAISEPYPRDWLHGNALSEGMLYGATEGSPWAIDIRTMELSYGPTLEYTDVTEEFVDAVGPIEPSASQ